MNPLTSAAGIEQNKEEGKNSFGLGVKSQLQTASARHFPSHPEIAMWHCNALRLASKIARFQGCTMAIAIGNRRNRAISVHSGAEDGRVLWPAPRHATRKANHTLTAAQYLCQTLLRSVAILSLTTKLPSKSTATSVAEAGIEGTQSPIPTTKQPSIRIFWGLVQGPFSPLTPPPPKVERIANISSWGLSALEVQKVYNANENKSKCCFFASH